MNIQIMIKGMKLKVKLSAWTNEGKSFIITRKIKDKTSVQQKKKKTNKKVVGY